MTNSIKRTEQDMAASAEKQAQGMRRAYLGQSADYYSDSSETLIPIAGMHPTHAANAARRLLIDALTWAQECGLHPTESTAAMWMVRQPLFAALCRHAGMRGM